MVMFGVESDRISTETWSRQTLHKTRAAGCIKRRGCGAKIRHDGIQGVRPGPVAAASFVQLAGNLHQVERVVSLPMHVGRHISITTPKGFGVYPRSMVDTMAQINLCPQF